jgi:transcriptional regulator with XRE-family HTH domain
MPVKRPPRSPNAIDVAVARNVRVWRLARGLSQQRLARRLGVSFQQVQKYEAGANRIGAGRLVKIAAILGVPVSVLLDRTQDDKASRLLALVSDSRSFRLAHAFAAIKHGPARRLLVNMVENIAAAAPRSKRRRR